MENEIVKQNSGATPAELLQLAVQQNLDIDKLEKLMQLQERWQAGLARKDFLSAISKFQALCPPLEKTKKVGFKTSTGFTSYSYAPLGEIAATIKKAMSDNELSHRWEIEDITDKIICTCIISHINGHSEKTTMSAAKDSSGGKNEIQQRGSTITYLQRYTLIAALGISTADEDVDGAKEIKKENIMSGAAHEFLDENIIFQWQNSIANCKTKGDLLVLYNGNKATVDASPEIKELFKARQKLIDKMKKQTAYNHVELEKNGLPLISNLQFKKACERINAGEKDIYFKVLAEFSLEPTQAQILKTTYGNLKTAIA